MVTEEMVREILKDVYDPELYYNIVDLGLVYNIDIQDGEVKILMTLTTPACPIGPMMEEQVRDNLLMLPGVSDVEVEFTFDPLWDPSRMSEEARADLGLD